MQKSQVLSIEQLKERILDVRYTDPEAEKISCLELLALGLPSRDLHAIAFAYTYLGDYYLVQNDMPHCGANLLDARQLAEQESFEDLLVRIYCLQGIYFQLLSDDQNAFQCYLSGITLAQKRKDTISESIIYNNIAFKLQSHQSYDNAMIYYRKAYDLLSFAPDPSEENTLTLLSNMAELAIWMGRFEEARSYLDQCSAVSVDPGILRVFESRTLCCYYSELGQEKNAFYWADRVLDLHERTNAALFSAFDSFISLCNCMMKIGNRERTYRFLSLVEECCSPDSLDQVKSLYELRAAVCLRFESPAAHDAAYREYYAQSVNYKTAWNQLFTQGMRDSIKLHEMQKERTAQQEKKTLLLEEANRDELTGVYNRRYLHKSMLGFFSDPAVRTLSVVMIDIDFFKEYNDCLGHACGDDVLRTIGKLLLQSQDPRIHACRYGGDEFTCLCVNLSGHELKSYVEDLRNALAAEAIAHPQSACSSYVTLSIGYASAPLTGTVKPFMIMDMADQALYLAKKNGRNTSERAVMASKAVKK